MKKKEDNYLNLRLLSKKNVGITVESFAAKFPIDQDGKKNTQRRFGDVIHLTLNGPCMF